MGHRFENGRWVFDGRVQRGSICRYCGREIDAPEGRRLADHHLGGECAQRQIAMLRKELKLPATAAPYHADMRVKDIHSKRVGTVCRVWDTEIAIRWDDDPKPGGLDWHYRLGLTLDFVPEEPGQAGERKEEHEQE